MISAATKIDRDSATERVGWVLRVHRAEGTLEISLDGGTIEAKRAMSCMLDPAAGDRVLVALIGDGSAFVLAVLEREGDAPGTMSLDRDLTVELPAGRLSVVTGEGVAMASAGGVSVVAPSVDVKAVDGRIGVERLAIVGKHLLAELANVKVAAQVIDSIADRVRQNVKRAYKIVSELDQIKAQRVDWTAEKMMHLHGENTVMSADELVKVDGEHIHMG
ncbi:MAG: DUF3540 domain-containing protein [Polyangiaceae bacterium]|nr:DUF3540 domain-containing protein [Polyangiaceae bacterium]NUQ76398.1 DUF3540 domain-containing protein [Polyangiaceae bacterium]